MQWVILDPGLVSLVRSLGSTVDTETERSNDSSDTLDLTAQIGHSGLQAIDFAWGEHSISELSVRFGGMTETG